MTEQLLQLVLLIIIVYVAVQLIAFGILIVVNFILWKRPKRRNRK